MRAAAVPQVLRIIPGLPAIGQAFILLRPGIRWVNGFLFFPHPG